MSKIIDFFGNENSLPDTDFENGRQDAIANIINKLNVHYKFLLSIKDGTENIAIPNEFIKFEIDIYKRLIDQVQYEKFRNLENKYYANSSL